METVIAVPPVATARRDVYLLTHVVGISLLLAFSAEAINRSGLDLTVAGYFFDAARNIFPWRSSRLLDVLGHRLVLVLPIGVAIVALAAALASYRLPILRPWRSTLWGVALTCGLGQVIISQLKHHTALPRPYDLSMFGGYAAYPLHWWARNRQDAGGALPSGHAGAGYALLSLYFAGWALGRPAWRWGGLAAGAATGLLFSAVRISQGAHFLSQTVWSAAVMWCLASLLFYPVVTRRRASAQLGVSVPALPAGIRRRMADLKVWRRHSAWIYGLLAFLIMPFIQSWWAEDSNMHQGVQNVGMALIFAAILGRAWCAFYAGGRKGTDLMQQGPYSISRNPSYLLSLVGVVGVGAQSGSILLGPILAIFVFLLFERLVTEEELKLAQAFGADFARYCERVPRFGPRWKGWDHDTVIQFSAGAWWQTVRDALPFLLSVPLFEGMERLQAAGWLPVLVRLP